MRAFTAIVPAAAAIDHLDAFLEPRRSAADFRWARPEQMHLTLAFMADAPERHLDAYVDRLAESLDDIAPAPASLTGAVAFPNVVEGRVLAVGVSGPAPLEQLAVRVRNAAVASGIEVDGQRFRPHVTVARTGGRKVELTSWVRLLSDYAGPAWSVGSVAVIGSHLGEGPRGTPRYELLAEVLL
ncbi:hypothetical protein GCM10022237_23530 [Nocardioides ginsengisoli]|uniref:RNA 2',3'-cyclic phosphodiesterase n=1 Tax=Nocardioides ginsengisoli TaxID=363868 RepID=A0ABW3W7C6_9ACTN